MGVEPVQPQTFQLPVDSAACQKNIKAIKSSCLCRTLFTGGIRSPDPISVDRTLAGYADVVAQEAPQVCDTALW